MKSLLILGCSATKRTDAALIPAIDRYDGPLYRVLRGWMRETPDHEERLLVMILSAEYGFIRATDAIPNYDRRMTLERAAELQPVTGRVRWPGPYTSVYISLGATYRLALPTPLPWPAQFAQGGIGTRLAGLKAWLGGLS
jgi:hypothetical protein